MSEIKREASRIERERQSEVMNIVRGKFLREDEYETRRTNLPLSARDPHVFDFGY